MSSLQWVISHSSVPLQKLFRITNGYLSLTRQTPHTNLSFLKNHVPISYFSRSLILESKICQCTIFHDPKLLIQPLISANVPCTITFRIQNLPLHNKFHSLQKRKILCSVPYNMLIWLFTYCNKLKNKGTFHFLFFTIKKM